MRYCNYTLIEQYISNREPVGDTRNVHKNRQFQRKLSDKRLKATKQIRKSILDKYSLHTQASHHSLQLTVLLHWLLLLFCKLSQGLSTHQRLLLEIWNVSTVFHQLKRQSETTPQGKESSTVLSLDVFSLICKNGI